VRYTFKRKASPPTATDTTVRTLSEQVLSGTSP
jgi:hypothetical protein